MHINIYPHYQMSITKSYLAMGIGRAIQLGHLRMDDLKKPVVDFLKQLDRKTLVDGADKITVHEALQMTSGLRLPGGIMKKHGRDTGGLKGQRHIQVCLQYCAPIPPAPRGFRYQRPDTWLTMQVLEAVVPGSARDFLKNELLAPMGITAYHWDTDYNGLPTSGAGTSLRSRDMLKMGMLILNHGKWQGKQHLSADFVKKATSPLIRTYENVHYGYYWWLEDFTVNGKKYHGIQGRGVGGQFIFVFPELELITIVTAHNQGSGNTLHTLPQRLIPAFTKGP